MSIVKPLKEGKNMNVGTVLIAICYVFAAICMSIAGFLVNTALGFATISVFLLAISVVLYKELNEGGVK